MSLTDYKYLTSILRQVIMRFNAAIKSGSIDFWGVSYDSNKYKIDLKLVIQDEPPLWILITAQSDTASETASTFITKLKEQLESKRISIREYIRSSSIIDDPAEEQKFLEIAIAMFIQSLDSVKLKK